MPGMIRITPEDVLIVVDVQNDFLPGGALAVPDGGEVIEPINRLAKLFSHVVLTQDWHPPGHASFASSHPGWQPFETTRLSYGSQVLWPDHCIQGTSGAEIASELDLPNAELVIRKGTNPKIDSYSGFMEADRQTRTGLAGYLTERGFRRVFCAGLAMDYCVSWTALDAKAAGFEAFVIGDASRAIDNQGSLASAFSAWEEAGVRKVECEALARAGTAQYPRSMSDLVLYGNPGWGSALVEAQLDWLGLSYRYEAVGNLFTSPEARERVGAVNPLAQVPTLVLEDGRVLTESAAITLYLADLTGRDDLVPGPKAPERAEFLRWLVYFVANVYPTFTYADDPARFVPVEAARQPFREAVDAYAKRLYGVMEETAGAPWFLGDRFSALDIYLMIATRWRPRRAWFVENAPKLNAIALRVDALPQLEPMRARNFPEG